ARTTTARSLGPTRAVARIGLFVEGARQAGGLAGGGVLVDHALGRGLVEGSRGRRDGGARGGGVGALERFAHGADEVPQPGLDRLVAVPSLLARSVSLQRGRVLCHGRGEYHAGQEGSNSDGAVAAFATAHRRSRSASSSSSSRRPAAAAARSTWRARA